MLQGGLLLQQGNKGNGELGQIFGGRSAREPAALTAAMRQLAAVPPSTAGYYSQALAASVWTGLPWLRLLTMPTLALAGSDDRLVPAANSRVIAALAPGARLRILRGAGHLLVLDDVERTAAELTRFLDA
jgi:pimeloyl-ACP methyl ester carboxylesterase